MRVYGLSSYYQEGASPRGEGGVVLGYAGFPPQQAGQAVSLLAGAWGL